MLCTSPRPLCVARCTAAKVTAPAPATSLIGSCTRGAVNLHELRVSSPHAGRFTRLRASKKNSELKTSEERPAEAATNGRGQTLEEIAGERIIPAAAASLTCVEESSEPHGAGTLVILAVSNFSCDAAHPTLIPAATKVPRKLRVWLPPGYNRAKVPLGGYPLLLLNDGQNLFDDKLSFSGCSWRAGLAASALICDGTLPPFIIVGIDHAGAWRSYDYLPCPPGTGAGGVRPEAKDWPGGGAGPYCSGVVDEVLPLVAERYGSSCAPARMAFGGSSFGGICALEMAARRPGRFGGLLVESPSFWMADGNVLRDVLAYDGPWPQRVFLAMGTKEYSGARNGVGQHVDELLAESAAALAKRLGQRGLLRDRLQYLLEQDAPHSEWAWAMRLPQALRFLGSVWWTGETDSPGSPGSPESSGSPALPAGAPALPAGADEDLRAHAETAVREAARAAARDGPDGATAATFSSCVYFTMPQVLLCGEPATVYFNRAISAAGLAHSPEVQMRYGFDGWSKDVGSVPMRPTTLWRSGTVDWWSAPITVPEGASDLQFVFRGSCGQSGEELWDNNGGADYTVPVRAEPLPKRRAPRRASHVETRPLAGGVLHVMDLEKRGDRAGRWQEERVLRVWTPWGFDPNNAPPEGYPLMMIADGQNIFEDETSHQGVSWRAADAAAGLIGSGALKPFIIVGIDGAGAFRSLNYLPYPPGSGAGGFRGDCARWPGGGVDAYIERVVEDYLPLIGRHFPVATDRNRLVFGGASFGGIAALHMARKAPHVFGGILCESPSLWVKEGSYLQDMWQHNGRLPDRLFLGAGTKEYSATRDHERDDVDELLLNYAKECAHILGTKGLKDGRLKFQIDEGAGHHESAWAWRMSGAMQHLWEHLGPGTPA